MSELPPTERLRADPQVLAAYVRSRLVEIVSERKRDAAELKALELLGKSAGMFDPRSHQAQQHLHLHTPISDAEAAQLAERARLRDCAAGLQRTWIPQPKGDITPSVRRGSPSDAVQLENAQFIVPITSGITAHLESVIGARSGP